MIVKVSEKQETVSCEILLLLLGLLVPRSELGTWILMLQFEFDICRQFHFPRNLFKRFQMCVFCLANGH